MPQHRHHPLPFLGYGLGLRAAHYPEILTHKPAVDWFEIITENFMDTQGRPRRHLDRIRADYPIVMHGVSLSIGTVDPLNSHYLMRLKHFAQEIEPAWISDHVCWTGVAHKTTHDLLPVPYTREALEHMIRRIGQVQDMLGRPIALENPSTYLEFAHASIPEAEFIAEMVKRSGCHLLLDVNNVYVTCFNHGLEAKTYIDALPLERVIQVHLSGHSHMGTHIIDTHDDHVADAVWDLYRYVVARAGREFNTMIEWDDKVPPFAVVYAELQKAKSAAAAALLSPLPATMETVKPVSESATGAMDLALSQHHLQQAILQSQAPTSTPWIRDKGDFAAHARLAVYRDAYRLRLRDSVAEDYPVLAQALGEGVFTRLLDTMIETTPPTHYNIGRYSEVLPAFFAHALPHHRFAHELATLENALLTLADAPESKPLDASALAVIAPETVLGMILTPRTALQLFAFTYPVNAYYEQVMAESSPPIPAPNASYLAVFRHEDTVWRMALEPEEYTLLHTIFSGATIAEALAQAAACSTYTPDQLIQKLTQWFARWSCNGLLSTHEYQSTSTERITPHAAH